MRSLNIKYIPELDHLRGIAALLVLLFHAIAGYYLGVSEHGIPPVLDNPLKLIITNGFTGVALFFVISGFLFTWGALQTGGFEWRKFYANRLLRIYPMYILMLIIAFSLARGHFSFIELLQALAGFGNMSGAQGDFDIVLWTISVELQFYMLFPFLINLLRRKGPLYLWGIIAVLTMFRALAWLNAMNLHDAVYWTLFGRLDQFLIGMLLAYYAFHHGWLQGGQDRRIRTRWLVAGLAGSLSAMYALFWLYTRIGWKFSETYLHIIWPTLEALAWAAVGVCYVAIVRRHQSKLLRALQFMGMISYSLYLLHLPIIKALHARGWIITIPGDPVMTGLVSTLVEVLPITIIASVVTYYVIEKPPLDLRRQYTTFRDKQPAPVVSGSDA